MADIWTKCTDCGRDIRGERLRCDSCHDRHDDNDYRKDEYYPPWVDDQDDW